MPVTGVEFRSALSRWASGVTIVTSAAGGRIHGMTVSAFASVSLDPPLVLVCADRTSDTLAVIEASGVFAANVLSAGQQALSNRFATKKDEHLRSGDFFSVKEFPEMTFVSKTIKAQDANIYHVTGDFTLRGVTKYAKQ